MEYLSEHRIGIEMNLTSNVQTNSVPSFIEHPFKRFLSNGLLVTINTDDPVVSGIDWSHELDVAAPDAGLSDDEIAVALANALEIAFVSDGERAEIAAAARARAGTVDA